MFSLTNSNKSLSIISSLLMLILVTSCMQNPFIPHKDKSKVTIKVIVANAETDHTCKLSPLQKSSIIANMLLTITASDISAISRELTATGDNWTCSVEVKKGTSRTFSISATDDDEVLLFEGSSTVNLESDNENVSISLTPNYQWRFADVSIYNPSDGIGFSFGLIAIGFKNITRVMSIYAVYKKNDRYYLVPGTGYSNHVADVVQVTPERSDYRWDGTWYLYDKVWDEDFKNNSYPQYIGMEIYKSANISSLNDDCYDETGFFSISWDLNKAGKPVPKIIDKLSWEESQKINTMLKNVEKGNLSDSTF